MTPDRWSRIESLFEQAADLPAAQRGAFLDAACRAEDGTPDRALREEIEGLLAAEAGADAFLHRVGETVLQPALDPLVGTRAGPWRIVREVGRGGMGTVYLAERADGRFEQRAALKVLHDARPSVVRRFEAERRLLARLDHPGVARLLDGGVLDDGRPYLVMEYVDGEPLTAYADRRALSVNERLALFAEVCEAVRYAHTRLVVHRDLKPSNILVTGTGESGLGTGENGPPHHSPRSSSPRVKLLDFGIAKLLGEEEAPALTTAGAAAPMTPEYAAPEQVRGDEVTTATDVYALGVLLYELLTGHRPYRLPSRVRHAVERAILEEEPTVPSAAAGQTDAPPSPDGTPDRTPEAIAAARGSAPDRLRRRLRGDLDQIILKALRKEPAQRYASAEALGRDLARHLDGLPVEARPPSAAYRAGRFARRHRAPLAAAAAALALMVALSALYAVRVTAARDRAEVQAARAERLTADLVALFEAGTPEQARGDTLTARELLAAGAARVEARLGDNPDADAPLALALARVYTSLADFPAAERWAARAQQLYERSDGAASVGAVEALEARALAAWRGSGEARVGGFLRAADRRARALGADSLRVRALAALGEFQSTHPDSTARAERTLAEALRIGRAAPDVRPLLLVPVLQETAFLRYRANRQDEAVALYREALAIVRAEHRTPHPDLAYALLMLARILPDADAEPLAREAVAVSRRVPRGTEPVEGRMLGFYADVVGRLGRTDEALRLARQALRADRRDYGPDHQVAANTWMTLAWHATQAGAHAEAEQAAREGVARIRQQHAPEDGWRLTAELQFATALLRAGKRAEAAALAGDLVRRFEAAGRADRVPLARALLDEAAGR
jgi:serine/threonine-protein kinase